MYSPLQSITLDGLQVKYRVQGEGPGVLMVHGWASSSRMWQRMMDDLGSRYRGVALDLPGFGDSEKPGDTWYSMSGYVRLVNQFTQALGLHRPAVIGHSMGGMIAIAMAAEDGGRLSRLIAINPVVTGRTYLDLRMLANPRLGWPMLKLGRWFWPLTTSDVVGPWLGHERSLQLKRIREDWGKSTPISAMATARAMGQCDLTPLLPRIATRTLIVLGSRDLTAPNAEGKLAARRIPGARTVMFPTGHLPTDDMPDETNAAVESFLAGEPVAAAERLQSSAQEDSIWTR